MKNRIHIRIVFVFLFFAILIGFLGWGQREALGRVLSEYPKSWPSPREKKPEAITDKDSTYRTRYHVTHPQAYLRGYEYIGSIVIDGLEDEVFEEARKRGADLFYLSSTDVTKAEKGQFELRNNYVGTWGGIKNKPILVRSPGYAGSEHYSYSLFRYNPDKTIALKQGLLAYADTDRLADPKYLNQYLEHGLDPNTQYADGETLIYRIIQTLRATSYSSDADEDEEDSQRRLKAIELLLAFKANPNVVGLSYSLLSLIDEKKETITRELSDTKNKCQSGDRKYREMYCETIQPLSKKLEIIEKIEEAVIGTGATRDIKFAGPGHIGKVHSVEFSPDGRLALSGGADKTLRLWDMATGKELRVFIGHKDDVWSVKFSPDGRLALSGGKDSTHRLWDVATGKQIRYVWSHVVFSPDGRSALSWTFDENPFLWDVATGKEIRKFIGHKDDVYSVAFSPDGRLALSGGFKKTLFLWDVATGKEIRKFTGHKDAVYSVVFSPDGRSALSRSFGLDHDHTMRLWDVATGKEIRSFGHKDDVDSVAFSPDGMTALSETSKTVFFWDLATGKEIRSFARGTSGVAFSPDGRSALSQSDDKTLFLWDVATGKEIRSFTGHKDDVYSVKFSPDGRSAFSWSSDNTIRLWDVATGKEIRSFTIGFVGASSVALSVKKDLSQAAPLDAEGYYKLGVAHGEAGRYQEASEAYKQAIKLKPDYASAYNNLGSAYDNLDRYQEASEAFKQAIKLKPDDAIAHYNLGIVYYALSRYQEAIDAYKRAIKLKPDDIDAHYNLGIAYLGIKDKASALKEYEILKKMDLARATQLSNKIASVEKDLSQAAPLDADGYYNLGIDHADAGRWKEAIEAFKQAIKLSPDDATAHYNLGVAYGNLGRWQEAIEVYKQAIKLKPDYAKAYNNLGSAYENLGRHQEAIQACKQAVKLKPDYANAHYALGLAYLAIGDKARALEEYKILKTLNPEWANTLFNLINKS